MLCNTGDLSSSTGKRDEEVVDPPDQPDGVWINEKGEKVDNPKSYACAPEDWETNDEYHPINVAIWTLWLAFYFVLMPVPTLNGFPIDHTLVCGPYLPWHLKPGERFVLLIL